MRGRRGNGLIKMSMLATRKSGVDQRYFVWQVKDSVDRESYRTVKGVSSVCKTHLPESSPESQSGPCRALKNQKPDSIENSTPFYSRLSIYNLVNTQLWEKSRLQQAQKGTTWRLSGGSFFICLSPQPPGGIAVGSFPLSNSFNLNLFTLLKGYLSEQ